MSTLPTLGKLDVYFPFADGALGYHCGECGFRCCKGAGFGATERELVQLTARYPFVSLFVNPRREPEMPLVQLTNFAPNCFFLRDDGLCKIENDHGRALKPHVCRTFPVNQLSRTGDTLVADLNFLCPLRPLRAGDTPVRYDDVIADLAATIEVAEHTPQETEGVLPEALLRFERFLRDLPVDDDLLRRLATSDLMAARWQKEPRVPSDALVAAHREHLVALRTTIVAFLGSPPAIAPDRARFPTELGIMLPRLRLSLLRTRSLLPSADESLAALLPQLGRRLTALSVYLELCVDAGATLTLGLVDHAFRQGTMFCEMLSLLDRIPTIEPAEPDPRDAYQLTLFRTQEAELQRLLRFIHDENPRRRLPLGAIFQALCIEDTGVRAQVLQSFTREALGHFCFDAT